MYILKNGAEDLALEEVMNIIIRSPMLLERSQQSVETSMLCISLKKGAEDLALEAVMKISVVVVAVVV